MDLKSINSHSIIVLALMLGCGMALCILGQGDIGHMLLAGALGFATPQPQHIAGGSIKVDMPDAVMPSPLADEKTPKA